MFVLGYRSEKSHPVEFRLQQRSSVPLNWETAQTARLGKPSVIAQLSITRLSLPTLILLSHRLSVSYPVLSITVWLRIPASPLITPPPPLSYIFPLRFSLICLFLFFISVFVTSPFLMGLGQAWTTFHNSQAAAVAKAGNAGSTFFDICPPDLGEANSGKRDEERFQFVYLVKLSHGCTSQIWPLL